MTRANQIQLGANLQPRQHNQEECAKQYLGCVSQILLPAQLSFAQLAFRVF